MHTLRFVLICVGLVVLALAAPAPPAARAAPGADCFDPNRLLVTNGNNDGVGSLRLAIVNANTDPNPNIICFYPPVHAITLLSDLPDITDDDLTIDASPNWHGSWPTGEPGVSITGPAMMTVTVGLRVSGASNFAVKGLMISSFGTGIRLENGASRAVIGSPNQGGRMLIRGIRGNAIEIVSAHDNKVVGSYIGTSDAGNLREPNSGSGVAIVDGQRNQIGGGYGLEGNLIGSSGQYGVDIMGSNAISNTVINNSIGIGVLNGPITNTLDGVHIGGGASMNGIGGVVYRGSWGGLVYSPTIGNTIYGSGRDGVRLEGGTTSLNGIMGSDIDGSVENGIYFDGASNNLAGGNTVIHGRQSGVILDNGASLNWIVANWVGTNPSGDTGLGNGQHAIGMYGGAQGNTIDENWTVASGWSGIVMVGADTQDNWLVWNKIGLGPEGKAMGNTFYGVHIVESPLNILTANQIANNGTFVNPDPQIHEAGVYIQEATAIGNAAWQNSIHDNDGPGIVLANGANHNLAPPAITSATCPTIRGTGAPSNGIVQVFSDNADEGAIYEGRTVADGNGKWLLATKWTGPHLTATASLTATVTTGTTLPAMAAPAFTLLLPDGPRTRGDGPAAPAAVHWDSSPFSAPVTAASCRPVYLPLIAR